MNRPRPFQLLAFFLAGVVPAIAGELADSPSAFARAQAGSSVKWHAWDAGTLAAAAKQEKPVYVFVGSALSGLTLATLNQTFASASTVDWMNESFFCIFVDEDTQPEVAAYAQYFINSVKQMRGSPVHFWLTPDMQPYDGANYLPPSEEWGRPGFLKATRSALDVFNSGPERVKGLSGEAMAMMQLIPLRKGAKPDVSARLAQATTAWTEAADAENGGFGGSPKNPEPELVRFMLTRGGAAKDAAVAAARAIATSAVHDPVDGGFYRRSIDEAWKEPYHQKLLADQARIALALFAAGDVSGDATLRKAAIGALDFVLKDLKNPDGSFTAALDGTLDTNTDPGHRPEFVRTGTAPTGSLGLLIVALKEAGGDRYAEAATEIGAALRKEIGSDAGLPHIPVVSPNGTAADYTAVALGFRALGDDALAGRLLDRANKTFFDATFGRYMASPAELPAGIAFRAPAVGDTPSPELLALLAGVDAGTADLLKRGLFAAIEYDEQPAGDALLGLSR